MSDKLLEVIEDLQPDKSLNSLSEADISLGVVLRILDALNWSTYNRREVSPEYSVENRWVDYALLIGNTPQVFIEVKKGGEPLEKHQEQLLDYAFRQGVKVAVLTNGAIWWFYLPLLEVNWEQRKSATVEFDKQDKAEIVQKLIDLLDKENVRSGKAVQNAEYLYEQNQRKAKISAVLPKAWNQLVNEPDDFLVELLADKADELCGYKPEKKEVEQFLSVHLQNIRVTSPPAVVEPIPTPESKPSDRRKRKAFTVTKPEAFTFNGSRHEIESWRGMLVRLCEIVHAAHRDRFEEVLNLRGRNRPYFSRNSSDLREYRAINKTGIYVEVNQSATSSRKLARELIFLFGYDEDDLSFEEIE